MGASKKPAVFASVLDRHLDHQISGGKRPPAHEHVDRALRACLPLGVPPSYASINAARYVSAQPRHEATAELTMFDGREGRVRVWFHTRGSYAHEWLETGGGEPCSFENGAWIRIDPTTLEPAQPGKSPAIGEAG